MRVVLGVILFLALLAGGGIAYLYSGFYNVAASEPHGEVARWLLDTALDNSVREQAEEVVVPPFSRADVERGAQTYAQSCVICHGAPGVERSAIGRGLRPQPPDLGHAAREWLPGQLYWIAKHGLKFTGMPAWGASLSDAELWSVVAFVEQLPGMSADEYRRLLAAENPAPAPPAAPPAGQ